MADTQKTYVACIDFAVINDSKGRPVIHAHEQCLGMSNTN